MSRQHIRKSTWLATVASATVGFLSLVGADSANSASVLVNGRFDIDTSGWTAAGGAVLQWDPQDAAGRANSGSAVIAAVGLPAVRSGSGAYQCVPVTQGKPYLLSSFAGAPLNQPRKAFPGYRVAYYDSPACSGTMLDLKVSSHPEVEMGKWWVIWRVLQPPPGATHAWIGLMTWGEALAPGQTATDAQVKWDDVTLVELPRRAVIASMAADR